MVKKESKFKGSLTYDAGRTIHHNIKFLSNLDMNLTTIRADHNIF
jgi:hypothetical protein